MGITAKLLTLGWVDAQGRSLSWRHWKENKKPRQAVAYLRNEKGKKPTPIYSFLEKDFKLRERKAA